MKEIVKKFFLIFNILFFLITLSSCFFIHINKNMYVLKNIDYQSSVYCEEVNILCYFSEEIENLKYIIMTKLLFQLEKQKEIKPVFNIEEAKFIIYPELIIKKYSENFQDYYSYIFSFKIISEGIKIAQFIYEYNGTMSIFNNNLLAKFINSFVSDLIKAVNKK